MPFRTSLLSEFPVADADVIMTAAVLGFSAGLVEAKKPLRFDVDGDADSADFAQLQRTVAKIKQALARQCLTADVQAGHAPVWKAGSVITGAKGMSALDFDRRHLDAFAGAARQVREIATDVDQGGYRGRGAYTGFVYNPSSGIASLMSTYRALIPNEHGRDAGRWYPAALCGKTGGDSPDRARRYPWGLILATKAPDKVNSDPKAAITDGGLWLGRDPLGAVKVSATDPYDQGGMGDMPSGWDSGEKIIGYTHGMIQAIVHTEARGGELIPFEIAVGNCTTKLASCFPCTMYMYAAGYPPSSIHLGRGESWVPYYPELGGRMSDANLANQAANRVNEAWYQQCHAHLTLGLTILQKSGVSEHHKTSFSAFKHFMSRASAPSAGANLILDALTVHVSESVRIERTLT